MVSSHSDPFPVLLSVKHLQEQLVLLKGKASKIAVSYFGAAVRAEQSPSTDPGAFCGGFLSGLCLLPGDGRVGAPAQLCHSPTLWAASFVLLPGAHGQPGKGCQMCPDDAAFRGIIKL